MSSKQFSLLLDDDEEDEPYADLLSNHRNRPSLSAFPSDEDCCSELLCKMKQPTMSASEYYGDLESRTASELREIIRDERVSQKQVLNLIKDTAWKSKNEVSELKEALHKLKQENAAMKKGFSGPDKDLILREADFSELKRKYAASMEVLSKLAELLEEDAAAANGSSARVARLIAECDSEEEVQGDGMRMQLAKRQGL